MLGESAKGTFEDFGSSASGPLAANQGLPTASSSTALKEAGVELDRKMLADLAVRDQAAFAKLVGIASQQEAT